MALEHVVDVQGNTLTFQQLDSLDVYIWSSSSMPSRCNACDGIILPTIERVWSSIVLRITLVTYPVHVQVDLFPVVGATGSIHLSLKDGV